jgi:hypothetical protein
MHRSPFNRIFSSCISDEEHSADDVVTNKSYSLAGFQCLQSFMYSFPLWSACMVGNLSRHTRQPQLDFDIPHERPRCLSNAAVESHFRGIKFGRFSKKLPVRPRDFVRRQFEYVQAKVNASILPKRGKRSAGQWQDTTEKWRKRKRNGGHYAHFETVSAVLKRYLESSSKRKAPAKERNECGQCVAGCAMHGE